MRNEKANEAVRLVMARETLKVVWTAYETRDIADIMLLEYDDVHVALEVALDEIDLALLRLPDVDITFEYRDDNENDSQ